MSGNEFNYDVNSKERALYITLTNTFQEHEINGSVLSTLTVLDQAGDTIGHEFIKGVPDVFDVSQTYALFIRNDYRKEISIPKMTIALENYCGDLPIITTRITKIKKESSKDPTKNGDIILAFVQITFDVLLILARLNW